MSETLPSLTALRAFEAAARHLNMSRAGDELFRTHGAVSRQIRQLEEELGVQLFVRGGRMLGLTNEGALLAKRLSDIFAQLEGTVLEVKHMSKTRPVVVACGSTVAVRWLVPRLLDFYQTHPGIELQLSLASRVSELSPEKCDVAILWSHHTPPSPGVEEVQLMQDRIGPVCSPQFWEDYKSEESLLSSHLIYSNSTPDAWESWAKMTKRQLAPSHELRFEHFFLALQASVSGLGVAIASAALVVDDLAAGNLVAPFGFSPTMSCYRALVMRPDKAPVDKDETSTHQFLVWLKEEARRFESELIDRLAQARSLS